MNPIKALKKLADDLVSTKKIASIKFEKLPDFRAGGLRITITDAPKDLIDAAHALMAVRDDPSEDAAGSANYDKLLRELFVFEYESIKDSLPEYIGNQDDFVELIENLVPSKIDGTTIHLKSDVEY